MRNIILFDDNLVRRQLLPLTYTRPCSQLRVGITTIGEKWQALLGQGTMSHLTATYLKRKYPATVRSCNLLVAGHVIPTPQLAAAVLALKPGQALLAGDQLVAFYGTARDFDNRQWSEAINLPQPPMAVTRLWHLFELNSGVLASDFARLTAGRKSQPLPRNCTVIGDPARVFLEPGACVEGAKLNTREGPIYIGEQAVVMEGACVRGPFAACHHAQVKMGAKIYGGVTLGPHCKVGGEVENTVFLGYSNKAHDGFIGDAVIGEWCNLGGGTTASNLKNDYGEIRLWNYATRRFDHTGLQFCGLIMGDHCKTGVNCMINTATVMGVGVNLHGAGFPRPFVPSFMEGSANAGFKDVRLEAFLATAQRVMQRRGIALTDDDRAMYQAIHDMAKRYK